jgi:transcriptional regulator with XRE-family HTH domain
MSAFGELLRKCRNQTIDPKTGRSYTQQAVGEAVGLGGSTIAAYENDETEGPRDPGTINRLAGLLDGFSVAEACRTLGYDVETSLSVAELDVVRMLRRTPEQERAILLRLFHVTATGRPSTARDQVRYDLQERAPRAKVADRGRE